MSKRKKKAGRRRDTLTGKQRRFVDEYLIDLNATAAAKRAGYSEKTAEVIGHENLSKPKIAAAIETAREQRSERTKVTAEQVVAELARIGFFDSRRLFTEGGHLKLPGAWDDDVAAAVSSVEVVVRPTGGKDADGNPEVEHVHKVKVWDKNSALEKLAKHLGMFIDKRQHTFTDPDGNPIRSISVEFV